ncbi:MULTISPECIES: SDR family oxidoreductase [Natrialbaceae]|uniref:SDR family oxidoreductase n=1 Tax=Natrialbaceae TaxID=1644061 RepID=UPI00207D3566|nr:SDR family oxidoreductase [Natronococcus sp. CG52]
MDLQLDGNSALVTASSSGLGKASARALAQEGANVVMNGRDEDRLQKAVEDVRADATGEVIGHSGDLTEPDDITALVDRTVDEFEGLDHLVTSAGGPPSGPFLEKSDEDWYDAFDLLVMSVVRLVRGASGPLEDGGGTVVNITSGSVKEAIDGLVLSNSVRMSVIGLEKTLSKELAPEVRANAVLPGIHETPRIREIIEQEIDRGEYDSYEEGLADRSSGIPNESIGDPMDLGRTVAFLSSPQSSYINGETITLDGGAGASNL